MATLLGSRRRWPAASAKLLELDSLVDQAAFSSDTALAARLLDWRQGRTSHKLRAALGKRAQHRGWALWR